MNKVKKLYYHYQSESEVAKANMPFLKSGGLFIPTTKTFLMGEMVECHLALVDEGHLIRTQAKVVWITPVGVVSYHITQGIGVEFDNKEAKEFIKVINELLEELDLSAIDKSYTFLMQ